MTHRFSLPLVIASVFFLTACGETVEGLKKDWGMFSNTVSEKTGEMTAGLKKSETKAPIIMQDKMCPNVIIESSMRRFVEFNDPEKMSNDMIVSEFNLTETDTICETDGEFVSMQIDMVFEGKIGPAANRNKGQKGFFSYPYFIAVSDLEGNILAEEVFAASVTYEKNEAQKKMVETIRQKLPLEDGIAPYQINVGFSLTEEQLQYNMMKKAK